MDLGNSLYLAHPSFLYALIPVGLLFLWQSIARKQSFVSRIVRLLALTAVVAALTGPYREDSDETEQLTALVDISGSMPTKALEALSKRLSEFTAEKRQLFLLPFAGTTAGKPITLDGVQSAETLFEAAQSPLAKTPRDATNFSTAFDAAGLANSSGPILLLSDGFETAGEGVKAAERLGSQNRPVFPLLVDESLFRKQQLEIASLFAPVTAQAGEKIAIYSSISNSLETTQKARVEIWLGEKRLSNQDLNVEPGKEERLEVDSPELEGGLHRIKTVLYNPDGTVITRHRWVSVKEKSKLLVLHGTEEDKTQIADLIRLKGYAAQNFVATGAAKIPETFAGYSAIVINNVSRHQLPGAFLQNLESFTKNGGGVLIIGGDKSFGLGNYIDTPLETISPLKFVPPQTEKKRLRVALALVLDKSGSMAEQERLLAAKRSIVMSMESLQPDDYITVIAFDHAPFVLIDIIQVEQAREQVDRRLRSLTAAGQTNLLPALQAARQKLTRVEAGRKHMIVLSDGQFPLSTSAYVDELNRLKQDRISVSAIALGSEADLPFMKFLAKTGNGSFHHTLDPSQLPDVFVEDIKVSTGEQTMAERSLYPIGVGPSGLQSTTVERYPPVRGFVETIPKRGASIELITKRGEKVLPILASWQFGAGRVAAFTSDANGRWSAPWLRWPDFVPYWSDVLEWIRSGATKNAQDIDFDVRYTVAQGELSLELLLYDQKLRREPAAPIVAKLLEPGGEQSSPVFSMVAPGRFEASSTSPRPGDYTLQMKYGGLDLPPVGITLHDDSFGEQAGNGIAYPTLEQIAQRSGGAMNPAPNSLSFSSQKTVTKQELQGWLIAAAFILVILEALLRELWRRV